MNLLPHARKVKFRLKFGDKEISSVNELKMNFSVNHILQSIESNQFSRWLEYLGETDLMIQLSCLDETKPTGKEIIEMFFPELEALDTTKKLDYWIDHKLNPSEISYFIRTDQLNTSDFLHLLDVCDARYPFMEEYVSKHYDEDTLYAYAMFLKGINYPQWTLWMQKAADNGSIIAHEQLPKDRVQVIYSVRDFFPTVKGKGQTALIKTFLQRCENNLIQNPRYNAEYELNELLRNAARLLLLLNNNPVSNEVLKGYEMAFKVNESNAFYVENTLIYVIILRCTGTNKLSKYYLEKIYDKHPYAKQLYDYWNRTYSYDNYTSWSLTYWPDQNDIDKKKIDNKFMLLTMGEKIAYVIASICCDLSDE